MNLGCPVPFAQARVWCLYRDIGCQRGGLHESFLKEVEIWEYNQNYLE